MIINNATKATRAIFNTLNKRQTIIVTKMPAMMVYTLGSKNKSITIATAEPIKLDLNRSMDSLLVSFSSGEITNMMDNNVQNNSKSGYVMYSLYAIKKPIQHRSISINTGEEAILFSIGSSINGVDFELQN